MDLSRLNHVEDISVVVITKMTGRPCTINTLKSRRYRTHQDLDTALMLALLLYHLKFAGTNFVCWYMFSPVVIFRIPLWLKLLVGLLKDIS